MASHDRLVMHEPSDLSQLRVRVELSGFADGPAQALVAFLNMHQVDLLDVVQHPLSGEDGPWHVATAYRDGAVRTSRRYRPLLLPWTFPLDLTVHRPDESYDYWFAFSCLAAGRGLAYRMRHPWARVIHWCVDFVPERFGRSPATWAYDSLDRYCCRHADYRVELSAAARDGRMERHRMSPADSCPTLTVPMGAWLDRTPQADWHYGQPLRIVYMGHLVQRQGVTTLIDALTILRDRGVQFVAEIVGRGPLEATLRQHASAAGISAQVVFHGFVPDHRDVERILGAASVAVAPYEESEGSFTQFADPGKIKAYLAAGLPIVTTGVPPNAVELEELAGALVVRGAPGALADGIVAVHEGRPGWKTRARSAAHYALRFEWGTLLGSALRNMGVPGVMHP